MSIPSKVSKYNLSGSSVLNKKSIYLNKDATLYLKWLPTRLRLKSLFNFKGIKRFFFILLPKKLTESTKVTYLIKNLN
jgi:hypothetical protein